jgi:hypothetical protein
VLVHEGVERAVAEADEAVVEERLVPLGLEHREEAS